jgi:hypothetical protein
LSLGLAISRTRSSFEEIQPHRSRRSRDYLKMRSILRLVWSPGRGHTESPDLRAHVDGGFAYVRGGVTNRDDLKPPVKNRFTDIFVCRDGRWQCVAGQESRLPEKR